MNPSSSAILQLSHRDGTSQAQRLRAALDPDYVSIDERSLKDLLAFVQKFAAEIRYWGVEDDQLRDMGDWSAFLGPDADLDELVAFMQEPERFAGDRGQFYTRPHLALLLTFLQLLRPVQDQLNDMTRRHLDFYYQQVLRMTKKLSVPDQVNVLIDLADDIEQFLLPAGTLLNAGADSLGETLLYATNEDIVVNHAQVDRLSSVHVEKRVIGIREAREHHTGPKNEAVIRMLEIALGRPTPGDPLPPYITGVPVDYNLLLALQQYVNFVSSSLFMSFTDLHNLIALKRQRDNSDAEWDEINRLLQIAGQKRDRRFRLNPTDPRDFDANLETAMGGALNFDGLTEVDDIYDLYEQRLRESVQQFIRDKLYFENVEDFFSMMQIKVRIDNQWREIRRILEEAGKARRNDPAYTIPANVSTTDFDAMLNASLGALTYPTLPGAAQIRDLDTFYNHLMDVEKYFYVTLLNFSYFMSIAEKQTATADEWKRVYATFAAAHSAMVYDQRKQELKQIREEFGFDAMINFAAGEGSSQTTLSSLDRLAEYITRPEDRTFLNQISEQAETNSVTPEGWEETYRIVERAQRVRLGEPVAQKVEWLNLYPAADATRVLVPSGAEDDSQHPRWETFGAGQILSRSDSPPSPTLGWAISSPLLALSQGQRAITLTLGFEADSFDARKITDLLTPDAGQDDRLFVLQVSTEKGWIEPDSLVVRQTTTGISNLQGETLPALQFEMTFGEKVKALRPLADMPTQGAWPVLRLMLAQNWRPLSAASDMGQYIAHYQPLDALVLRRAHLGVSVTGLVPAQMQNDETPLDPNKPFEPFGSSPVAGARFYLSHPELVIKKLDSLKFRIEWMGVPNDSFAAHYTNYPNLKDKTLTARISLIDEQVEIPFKNAQTAGLFAAQATAAHTITITNVPNDLETGRPGYDYQRNPEVRSDDNLVRWNRYVQWEVNAPGFQQDVYPALAAEKALNLATAIANQEKPVAANYKVNPPYTPKIKRLLLDYTASEEVLIERYQPGLAIDRIFYIHPFGDSEVAPVAALGGCLFLPQYPHEGELCIGIRDARPPQNLVLLFQMAEGSANPDLKPVRIQWSYLSANQWVSLDDGNVLSDSTNGLINSGIIAFSLEPAWPNTLLLPDLYWIRAAIAQDSDSVCDAVAILAQAVSATFVDNNNAPDHLSRPLPADSITELAQPVTAVAGIRQPYTSVGGMMAEQDSLFYTRISERLRHKHRALTMWDYEHLILEHFPQIYKAKCLPPDPDQPGEVTVIVIPDIRNKLPFNPFEPKAPTDLIAAIQTHLADHIPGFAHLTVKNAHYIPLKVRFAVRFLPGYNEGYYKQLLNDQINHFLSPWAYDEGADIVIGSRVYANVLINFIEEQPYIDFVAEMKLFTSEDGRSFQLALPDPDGYSVGTRRPDGVLVAARQHEIDMILEDRYEEENFRGINYMKIELDFIVG